LNDDDDGSTHVPILSLSPLETNVFQKKNGVTGGVEAAKPALE